MAPRPPPMTPAMTVLPAQDSMDAWIWGGDMSAGATRSSDGTGRVREGKERNECTIFVICTSCSDMPAVGFMPAIMPVGFWGKAMVVWYAGWRY